MSDDIMDTDFEPGKTGTFYNPMARPAERTLEERQADEHLNVLEKIVDRLDQRIDFYKSLDSISEDIIADPVLLAQTLHAHKLTVQNLESERGEILNLIN